MEDGGFTLVSLHSKRRRHVLRNSIAPKLFKLENASSKNDESTTLDVNTINRNLSKLKLQFSQQYLDNTISTLEELIGGNSIVEVRIIGIGNFENSLPSAFQFILAEAICEHFCVKNVSSQEPIATHGEKAYMQQQKINTNLSKDLLNSQVQQGNKVGFTLLYMIHCEHFMYERVLATNWSLEALRNIIIIGNDLRNHRPDVRLEKDECSFPFLSTFALICSAVDLNIPIEPYAFSDTYITYFKGDVLPIVYT